MNAEDLIALNEEIAAMARAGLPLDQGLAALAREMDRGRLRQVTAELAEDLRQGKTLPEALERQGNRVPPFYAALVTAGIRTGRIGEVLATPAGRRAWTRMIYAVPLAGTMIRSARLAAFTDLLSILVQQGVPLPESFHLAGEASSDPVLSYLSQRVRDALTEGQPLGEVLRGQGLVPEWVAWMAGLGEQRGQLGPAPKQ